MEVNQAVGMLWVFACQVQAPFGSPIPENSIFPVGWSDLAVYQDPSREGPVWQALGTEPYAKDPAHVGWDWGRESNRLTYATEKAERILTHLGARFDPRKGILLSHLPNHIMVPRKPTSSRWEEITQMESRKRDDKGSCWWSFTGGEAESTWCM